MEGSNPVKQGCAVKGKTVQHGAEFCSCDVCMLCENGKLEIPPELSTNSDELLVDPGEAYFVSSYGGCSWQPDNP